MHVGTFAPGLIPAEAAGHGCIGRPAGMPAQPGTGLAAVELENAGFVNLGFGGHGPAGVGAPGGGELLGGVRFADAVRPEAADALGQLRARGVRTAMISGDAARTCEAVAELLGVDEVRSEVLPHEKEQAVRELADNSDGTLAFIGDGINDAAALGAADLAVAIGGGSDVAVLAADVVLTRDDAPLSAVPALLRLAAATRRIITQNLVWAFTYNAVAIPLAVMGRLSPVVAAAAMAASSLAVVANSWRLHLSARR
ncbi:MAG: cation-translocating P-type ATPase [Coriobacteriia bacterium]|nr:cation-translocating P-type ATPase [Coriobacteriia bacterium]